MPSKINAVFSTALFIFMATEAGPVLQHKPLYDGEDRSPTTQKELLGWYSYGVAAEVFAVCGVGRCCIFTALIVCYLMLMTRFISPCDTRAVST